MKSKFGFTDRSFQLLEELHANNNREWFQPHKQEIGELLLDPFADLLEVTTAKLKDARRPMIGSKQTIFRLNRDVRFSKDKRPYKEHVSGLLTPSGSKKDDSALLYAHLAADGGFIASGFYKMETKVLNLFRDRIIEDAKLFRTITRKLLKAGYEFEPFEPLKSMPRGYSEYADHEHAAYLKLKSYVVTKPQTREVWIDGSIVKRLVALHKASGDLYQFGMEAMGTSMS
ncbi:DUF2461 domain-containing protein [Blastopirellula marina]|nr:DUF2461 domain-containing protein [Blastopirellula marina]